MRIHQKKQKRVIRFGVWLACMCLTCVHLPALAHKALPGTVQPAATSDIVVVGATPAGIMSAIAAARLGSTVTILEPTDHVGGIMTNGLTKCDIINKKAIGGLFTEFTQKLHKYYIDKYGVGSPQEKACKEGFESEPHVLELIFNQMLTAEQKITIRFQHRLKSVIKTGTKVTGVVVEDLTRNMTETSFAARVFIDATYEGDLFAFAGADYFIGRESRYEYGERQAGKLYCRFGYDELLPGSTGEGDRAIQAFCFRMNMTNVPENRVPVTKPAIYNRDEYVLLIDDIKKGILAVKPTPGTTTPVQFMPKPNGKFEINSNHASPVLGAPKISLDLPEENWDYPEADYAGRAKIVERYKNYHLGFIWFLQNDPELPEDFRKQMSEFGFSKNEYVNNNHFPRQIYVREARRLHGSYIFTQHEDEIVPRLGRTRIHPTSIAIAEYPWDSHGCSRYDPAHPGVREGYFYVEHKPMQIPYEVMVPKKIDGLLVPVAVSCSHVGQQTLRMEPGFMVYGQAAGIAAHMAIRDQVAVRNVAIGKVQAEIVRQKGKIAYLENISHSDPDFEAFQFLAARGANTGYELDADQTLTQAEALQALQRIAQYTGKKWMKPGLKTDGTLTHRDLFQWIGQPQNAKTAGAEPVSVRVFFRKVYDSWFKGA
jgi:hypothetical protein